MPFTDARSLALTMPMSASMLREIVVLTDCNSSRRNLVLYTTRSIGHQRSHQGGEGKREGERISPSLLRTFQDIGSLSSF